MTGQHMLNIGGLHEGVVLDHIPAGKAMDIYKRLKLDKLDCQVAMIMHARSSKMGQKDIIKVEAPLEQLNLDALGFIDHTITVNIIQDAQIVEKHEPGTKIGHIERFAFYDETKKAYAVIATGETALYANIILRKGVVK